jgi:hypothetical protein
VFWPLIGGFIAVVIITILIGRILETSARRDAERSGGTGSHGDH